MIPKDIESLKKIYENRAKEDASCLMIIKLLDELTRLRKIEQAAREFKIEVDKLLIVDEAHIRPSWDDSCWTKIGRDHPYQDAWLALSSALGRDNK